MKIFILLTLFIFCKKKEASESQLYYEKFTDSFKRRIIANTKDCKLDSSNFIYLYYLLCFYEDDYFVIDEITLGNEGSDYLTLIEVSENSINNELISDFDKRILFRWKKKYDQNNFNLFVNKIKVNNKEIIFYTKEKIKLNDKTSFYSGIKSKKKFKGLEIGKKYKFILSKYTNPSFEGDISVQNLVLVFTYNLVPTKKSELGH